MLTCFINISYFNYSSFLLVMLVPPCVRLRPVRSIQFSESMELNFKRQEFRACVRPIMRAFVIQESCTPYRYDSTAHRIARLLSTRSRKATIGDKSFKSVLIFFMLNTHCLALAMNASTERLGRVGNVNTFP